jgi:hypothetical protein
MCSWRLHDVQEKISGYLAGMIRMLCTGGVPVYGVLYGESGGLDESLVLDGSIMAGVAS